MVNTSEGRPPQHLTKMKLFNAIAAAAVIGASFIAPNPAEARNGWVFVGTMDGESNYMRPLGKSGNIARIEDKWSDMRTTFVVEYNCSSWQKRTVGGTRGWTLIYPGSAADVKANRVC